MTELTFYRPNSMKSLNRSFDRLFNQIREEFPLGNDRIPLVDIIDEKDRYVLEAELPGFTEEQIEIKVEDNLLTLKAEAKEEKRDYLINEISSRNFSRSFALPRNVDKENISASFHNGILTLDLAKIPQAKPRTIEVKSK